MLKLIGHLNGPGWCRRGLLGCVVITVALYVPAHHTHAEPVTFQFEAEVGTVFPGVPFQSGIEISEGDTVTGRFTFEPSEGDGSMLIEANQTHPFALNINGVELSTPSFEIEAVNNSPIADFPPASEIDSLRVGASGLAPIQLEQYPNIDPTLSGFRMTLFAPSDTLGQASVPEIASTWNEFDLRRQIQISFEDGQGGAVGFQATMREFLLVPEPSTGFLASLLVMASFTTIRIRS